MGWRNAHRVWVVLVILTVVIVPLIIGAGIGVADVVAQEDGGKDVIARTAPGENVTVQRGETVALGYPRGDTTRGYSWAYNWEVKNGDTSDLLLHTGSEDAAGGVPAHNGRVTSFRATEEGNYTVSLTVRALDRSIIDTVSRQITVSDSPEQAVSYENMTEYAPVLRFEEGELYRPTRIEAIFENAELRKGVSSSEQEFEVFSNANLYDMSVGERPEDQPDTDRDDVFEFILPNNIKHIWQGVFDTSLIGEGAEAGTDGAPDRDALVPLDPSIAFFRSNYSHLVQKFVLGQSQLPN